MVSMVVALWGIAGCDGESDGNSGEVSAETGSANGEPASPEGAQSDATAARGTSVADGEEPATDEDSRPAILFFGTSLTAGYGLDDQRNAFPGLIREKVDSAGLGYRTVNAGVPGETSAAGLRRIGWILDRTNVEILVLELGANDGLRGQDPEALQENLQAAIDSTRAHEPDATVVLAGMQAPPNLGPRYTEEFRRVFQDVARRNDAVLIPFLLEGVAGVAELNQSDRIHPTREGHRVIAETVWQALEPRLASP